MKTSATEKEPFEFDPSLATGELSHSWTFLSNHAHVLLLLAKHGSITMREIAQIVGITERAVQRIVADLVAGQYIVRKRNGRCNRYDVQSNRPLRHPVESHCLVGSLVDLIEQS